MAGRLWAGGGAGGAGRGAGLESQPASVGREGGRRREREKGGWREGCQRLGGRGVCWGRGRGSAGGGAAKAA